MSLVFAACVAILSLSAEPASQPVRGAAPLSTARTGDWAAYRALEGAQRWRVAGLTRLLVEVEVQTVIGDRPAGAPAIRSVRQEHDWARAQIEADGATVETRDAELETAGRRFDCRLDVARFRRNGRDYERRIWTAAEVPVFGLVKMELREGERLVARLELTAFGRGAEAAR